jgi:pilus assembly protein CpaC
MENSFDRANRARTVRCASVIARCIGLAILVACFLAGRPGYAQEKLVIEEGKSILLPIADEVRTVFISDTSVADANVSPDNQVFVFGKSPGETSLVVTLLDGMSEMSFTVVVTHNMSEIRSMMGTRFPGQQIEIESSRGSLLVTGVVEDEQTRATVIETLQGAVAETNIIDRLTVDGSNIIRLQVLLLEVSRTQVERFGIDWTATVANNGFFVGASDQGVLRFGKSDTAETSLSAAVDVLVSSGIATIVQETVLATVGGEPADFSVGGEIPVPNFITGKTDDGGQNFQLDYKFIGTKLSFTPVAAPGNKLRLLIESTVSAADGTIATVNGNDFPNLSTRSFRTNVELLDRQPFVIAGVSRNNSVGNLRRTKGGAFSGAVDSLFGADAVSGSSQELLVIVTPLLAENDDAPIEDLLPEVMGNLEYILTNVAGGKSPGSSAAGFGSAGFKY